MSNSVARCIHWTLLFAGWMIAISGAAAMTTARHSHTSALLPNGKVLIIGGIGASGAVLDSVEIFDPAAADTGHAWSTAQHLITARANATATVLQSGKVLVAGGGAPGSTPIDPTILSSAELYDPATDTWSPAGTMTGPYSGHTATLLANGNVLVAGGFVSFNSTDIYNPTTNTWSRAGYMNFGRAHHTATLLPNGNVLVTGGEDPNGIALKSGELWTGYGWAGSGVVRDMVEARTQHTATLLSNGTVMVVGGEGGWANGHTTLLTTESYSSAGTWASAARLSLGRARHTAVLLPSGKLMISGGVSDIASAIPAGPSEIYDPATGSWLPGGPGVALDAPTATLLPGGKVLLAGGATTGGVAASTWILFDSASNSWLGLPLLNAARVNHQLVLLPDGKVMAMGGRDGTTTLQSVEVRDPVTMMWSFGQPLLAPRQNHRATLLPTGKVLVTGGADATGTVLATTEAYDPLYDTWIAMRPMAVARTNHRQILLNDGSVLVVGGQATSGGASIAEADRYDPATDSWTSANAMVEARVGHRAVLLQDGRVLVLGGQSGNVISQTAELYDPVSNAWSAATSMTTLRSGFRAERMADGKVMVIGGQGTGGVYLTSVEIYDPVTNSWATGRPLTTARYQASSHVLPSGEIIVAGGVNGNGPVATAELYALGIWNSAGTLNQARSQSASVLLLDGSLLLVGGSGGGSLVTSITETYRHDPTAGAAVTRPVITSAPRVVGPGMALTITGSGFKGVGEASGGNGKQNAATNYPLARLQRLDDGSSVWLGLKDAQGQVSDTTFTTAPLVGMALGPALLTVTVNGVTSNAVQVLVSPHVDSLTLASSQPRSMVGQGVTFTVTVSGNAPTGQVQFRDGNGNLGSPVALVNGVASFTTSALSVGSHNISAVYAGDANNATNVLPVLVQTVLKAATIAAGHSHALEIRNGKLYAWGYNNDGALGDGTTMTRSFPAVVSLPTNVTPLAVAAGTSHSLAIGSDGKLYAWGSNRYGQVGDNSTTTRLNPVAISLGAGVTPIGVAAGGNQSAAIGSDGYLYMWGVGEILTAAGYVDPTALHLNNYSPQTWTSTPTPVPGLAISTIVVACGDWHNLAVSSIVPGIQAWGNNESGQLGFGFVSPSSSAGFVSPPSAAKVIAAGGNRGQLDGSYRPASPGVRSHSLAIGSDDLIYAWGSNDYGQLGDGTQVARPSPVAIQLTAQTLPVALAAGGLHSLAIGANGALFAWGYNGNGQVGDGTLVQRLAPVQVNLPQGITAVATAAGRSFSMALGSDGRLYTWGWNPQGQLGDGTNIDRSTPAALTNYLPVPQTGLTGSVSPSMAAQAVSFTVVVTGIAPTGTVQFKDGSANLGTPVPLVNGAASLTTATLGLGQHNITAVYSGDAANGPSTSNVVVQTVQPYRVLAGGYAHSLQILAGKLYAWGRNTDGELGDGTNTYRTSRALTQLPAVAAPVVVAAGDLHSMAIGSDGKLYAWGDNTAGTLGDGTTISRNLPAPVTLPGGAAPTAIAAGPYFSVAAGSDNKVYAWGGNFSGQLGDGSRANHALPAQVIMPANVGAVALAAGNGHVLAIGSNGLLYAWGYNAYGQLGDGTTTDRWTPVVVTLAPGVQPVAVAAGSAHSLAIGSDGNFYTWGWNLKGQLGDGTFNSRSAPGLVALPSGVTATFGAAGGNGHSLVIASDGNIYGWGDVFTRGWGHSGSVANSVVTTLPSGAAPIAIAAGENHSLVLGADGKLYAWGNNGFGQLGNKTLTDHVDPIEVSPYVPPAQVVVASSANPALVGQVVTIAVTVSGASPTGTVQFKDGNANLGSALILANGTASLTTSSLGVGSHVITAVYAGDANNAGNLSALFTQVVALSASTTSLYMSPNNAAAGQLQSFTAPVAGASPTGTVQFKDGGVLLGSAAIFNGQAVFATSTLSVGSHSITAFYSGDADNQASTSAALVFSAAAAGGSQAKGGGEDVDTPTLPEWGAILLAMLLLWVGAAPKGPCRPTSNCHVAAVPSPGRKY